MRWLRPAFDCLWSLRSQWSNPLAAVTLQWRGMLVNCSRIVVVISASLCDVTCSQTNEFADVEAASSVDTCRCVACCISCVGGSDVVVAVWSASAAGVDVAAVAVTAAVGWRHRSGIHDAQQSATTCSRLAQLRQQSRPRSVPISSRLLRVPRLSTRESFLNEENAYPTSSSSPVMRISRSLDYDRDRFEKWSCLSSPRRLHLKGFCIHNTCRPLCDAYIRAL